MNIKKALKKIINIAYAVLFLLILLIPTVTMNNKKGVVSKIDNRTLVDMPEFGTENFTMNFETYLKERIGGRNQMINAYAVLNDVVVNELTHPTYAYGQDDYIFFQMKKNIEYGDFHKTFAEMVLKLQNYCEERGSHFYFIFDPEKSSVYERYLPKGVNYDNSWVDSMMEYMNELGINYVNNSDLLTEKSFDEQVFNVQYDAGHWNDLGCFYATNALLNRIHKDIPEVNQLSKDAFNITTKVQATLPVSEFKINEEVPSFSLRTGYENVTNDYRDDVEITPSFPYFHYYINSAQGSEKLPKILFFQGSYYNRGPQFLVSATSEYIGIHNYQNILNLDYYYNIFQPDVVILDAAEYVFSDGYFNLEKMKALDFNPSIIDKSESFYEQLNDLRKGATLFQVESTVGIIQGNKIDKVIVERKFSDARYAYLIVGEDVFDLKRNNTGLLYVSIPHATLAEGEEALLFIEEYDGKKLYTSLGSRRYECPTDYLSGSTGVEFTNNNVYSLTTNIPKNNFDTVVLQLLNADTGQYIESLYSTSTTGVVQGTYIHEKETGWYKICLKANSNLSDEYVTFTIHLVKGEMYYYSFSVNKLGRKEVNLSNFQFYGYAGTKEIGIQSGVSKGVVENTAGVYSFSTEVEGNKFDLVVLEVLNKDSVNAPLRICDSSSIGVLQGIYTHVAESGWYSLQLKANSNLADEYIESKVYLKQGDIYGYRFELTSLNEQSVEVKDFVFVETE